MRGQQQSGTRRLNRHWQSGGNYVPPPYPGYKKIWTYPINMGTTPYATLIERVSIDTVYDEGLQKYVLSSYNFKPYGYNLAIYWLGWIGGEFDHENLLAGDMLVISIPVRSIEYYNPMIQGTNVFVPGWHQGTPVWVGRRENFGGRFILYEPGANTYEDAYETSARSLKYQTLHEGAFLNNVWVVDHNTRLDSNETEYLIGNAYYSDPTLTDTDLNGGMEPGIEIYGQTAFFSRQTDVGRITFGNGEVSLWRRRR